MSKLSDINNGPIKNMIGYQNNVRGVLAINAASAATIKTTAALDYINNGIFKNKAALSAQSLVPAGYMFNWQGNAVSAFYAQPVSTTVYYVVALDSSGNVNVVQGNYSGQKLSTDPTVGVGQSVAGATWVGNGAVPDLPSGLTPIGMLKVATNGSTTFTPGTTLLDAAGVTVTYSDLAVLPEGTP